MKGNRSSSIMVTNEMIKEEEKGLSSDNEVSNLKAKIKELREENLLQNQSLKTVSKDNQQIESQLVEAKMHWANLDLENDELAYKL